MVKKNSNKVKEEARQLINENERAVSASGANIVKIKKEMGALDIRKREIERKISLLL